MLLKNKHSDKGVKQTLNLAPLLLDDVPYAVSNIAAMVYEFSERGIDGEEYIKESLSTALDIPVEESLEESTYISTTDEELMLQNCS